MTTYSVRPRKDGQDFQGSWMVHREQTMLTNHTTKEAALNEAYRQANKGDTLRIHKQNGQIQTTRTVEGGSQQAEDRALVPGEALFETGVSDFFR